MVTSESAHQVVATPQRTSSMAEDMCWRKLFVENEGLHDPHVDDQVLSENSSIRPNRRVSFNPEIFKIELPEQFNDGSIQEVPESHSYLLDPDEVFSVPVLHGHYGSSRQERRRFLQKL